MSAECRSVAQLVATLKSDGKMMPKIRQMGMIAESEAQVGKRLRLGNFGSRRAAWRALFASSVAVVAVLASSYGLAQSAVYQSSLDRIIAFSIGGNGHLYDKYWNGSAWVWEDQGTPPGTSAGNAPAAVYQTSLDRIIAFVAGANGHLYDKYWNGSAWVWEDQGTPSGTWISQ
jgi:hypothetical protein